MSCSLALSCTGPLSQASRSTHRTTCSLANRHACARTSSSMSHRMSKRDSSAAGRLMFSAGVRFLSYRPHAGFAAAMSVVRVLRVVVMPALAMDTVCCSITYACTMCTVCVSVQVCIRRRMAKDFIGWLHYPHVHSSGRGCVHVCTQLCTRDWLCTCVSLHASQTSPRLECS